jgi:hypothetical protein
MFGRSSGSSGRRYRSTYRRYNKKYPKKQLTAFHRVNTTASNLNNKLTKFVTSRTYAKVTLPGITSLPSNYNQLQCSLSIGWTLYNECANNPVLSNLASTFGFYRATKVELEVVTPFNSMTNGYNYSGSGVNMGGEIHVCPIHTTEQISASGNFTNVAFGGTFGSLQVTNVDYWDQVPHAKLHRFSNDNVFSIGVIPSTYGVASDNLNLDVSTAATFELVPEFMKWLPTKDFSTSTPGISNSVYAGLFVGFNGWLTNAGTGFFIIRYKMHFEFKDLDVSGTSSMISFPTEMKGPSGLRGTFDDEPEAKACDHPVVVESMQDLSLNTHRPLHPLSRQPSKLQRVN